MLATFAICLPCLATASLRADEAAKCDAASIEPRQWITAEGLLLQSANEEDAAEVWQLRMSTRLTPKFSGGCGPLDMVGNLTTGSRVEAFKDEPLSDDQKAAITRLDAALQEARDVRIRADADHPADNLASYQAYLKRSQARQRAALRHAQRMVRLGLLSEPQSAMALRYLMTSRRPLFVLRDKHVQELLGLTPRQQQELEQASEAGDSVPMAILTPLQRKRWSQLVAEPEAPAASAEMRASTKADDGALHELSPLFRALADQQSSLQLASAYQRRLLDDLAASARDGVRWIRQNNHTWPFPPGDARSDVSDPVRVTLREFVAHAEQAALLGVFSAEEAAQAPRSVHWAANED